MIKHLNFADTLSAS